MNDLEAVRAALAPAVPPAAIAPTSAVLLPLVRLGEELCVLYTVRTAHLTSHAGEISFPGGRIEPGESPKDAALRETQEEVGVDPRNVDVLGHLTDFLTFRNQTVSCWVGALKPGALTAAPARNAEVDDAFLLPLARLRDPIGPRRATPQVIAEDPLRVILEDVAAYEIREFSGEGPERRIHYWRLANGRTLWGITAHLTAIFLERVYDWRPPVVPRHITRRDQVYP